MVQDPGPGCGDRGGSRSERGAFLVASILLTTALVSLSFVYFMQSRGLHVLAQRERLKVHARYCSEYILATRSVQAYLQSFERIGGMPDRVEIATWGPSTIISDNGFERDTEQVMQYTGGPSYTELVADSRSGHLYHFVTARGYAGLRSGGRLLTETHTSAIAYHYEDFSKFLYFSDRETSPENFPLRFYGQDVLRGRIHINSQMHVTPGSNPAFIGLFTQCAETVNGLSESQYDQVFRGGFRFGVCYDWSPDAEFDMMKQGHTAAHTYADSVTLVEHGNLRAPLTTRIRLEGKGYRVTQYVPTFFMANHVYGGTASQRSDSTWYGDTLYADPGLPTAVGHDYIDRVQGFPTHAGTELIWVKGVCRISGEVTGRITVLASDTLYIMDNVYTSDTRFAPCNDGEEFGMVPLGSSNRIGLASEGNIVIAATAENGAFNGEQQPALTCGHTVNSNIGALCQQNRKDVVITAALFAKACCFESEFWHSSISNALILQGSMTNLDQPGNCDAGLVPNNQNHMWNYSRNRPLSQGGPRTTAFPDWRPINYSCNTTQNDRRGTVWLCGSLTQAARGFLGRNPVGIYDPATIGYSVKQFRWDENFYSGGPPIWPKPRKRDGSYELTTAMVVPDYDRWMELREKYGLAATQAP